MSGRIPLMKTREFLPGLESEHQVGLTGVGVTVVDCTIACNTSMTAAELIAAPPNTSTAVNACGPVVHSLGIAPTAVVPMLLGGAEESGLNAVISFQYCTADNSAVYLWAKSFTGADPGVRARVIALR